MRKKTLFASLVMSVVTSFAALGGGCSSVDATLGDGGLTFDTGSSVKQDTGAADGGSACLGPSSSFGTAGAAAQMLNACSPSEIATLDTMINSASGTTYVGLYGMVGTSCQKCLFSNSTDATWQFFVWVPDMQHVLQDLDAGAGSSTVFDNSVAACIAHAADGGSTCSLATTHNDECYQSSCESCVSQGDYDGCVNSAAAAMQCGPADTRATDCTSKAQYDQALMECGFDLGAGTIDFKTLFNVTCGTGASSSGDGGVSEGGTDAGPG